MYDICKVRFIYYLFSLMAQIQVWINYLFYITETVTHSVRIPDALQLGANGRPRYLSGIALSYLRKQNEDNFIRHNEGHNTTML